MQVGLSCSGWLDHSIVLRDRVRAFLEAMAGRHLSKDITPKKPKGADVELASWSSSATTLGREAPKATVKLASTFTKAREAEAESIVEELGNDLELMLCVRHFIKEYKDCGWPTV